MESSHLTLCEVSEQPNGVRYGDHPADWELMCVDQRTEQQFIHRCCASHLPYLIPFGSLTTLNPLRFTVPVSCTCGNEYTEINTNSVPISVNSCVNCRASARRRCYNAQVPESEAATVAVHPTTGEVVYCFDRPDRPMPPQYAAEGFEKRQFQSLAALDKFCTDRGLVNEKAHWSDGSSAKRYDEEARAEREDRKAKMIKEMVAGTIDRMKG
jgi:hypothetical protein